MVTRGAARESPLDSDGTLESPLVADRERTAPHDLPRLRLPRADLPDHRRDERGWRHSLAKMQEHLHRRSMAPAESRVNKGARVAEGRRPSPHLAEDERRWQASSPVRVGAGGATSQCCTRPTSRATRSARSENRKPTVAVAGTKIADPQPRQPRAGLADVPRLRGPLPRPGPLGYLPPRPRAAGDAM